jgi:hypothetical protein
MKPVILALVVVLACTACTENGPTAPGSFTSQASLHTFSGTVPLQGVNYYPFSVTEASTVSITLASLSMNSTASPIVGLGIGKPSGHRCILGGSVIHTAPGSAAHISTSLLPALYCVQIVDIGHLRAPAQFTIRVVIK